MMKRINLIYILIVLAAVPFLWGNEPESVANYKIKAKLLPDKRMIEGDEILHWRNMSKDKVNNLCFHLYMNAFKNESTIFMDESKGIHRQNKMVESEWGYIDIKSIRMADGRSLLKRINIDDTIMRVDLYEPIDSEKELFLEITFNVKLPQIFARTGYFGEFYMVGQWFPKIAVYANEGWNCHYFHSNSEFYSDFGQYSVDISVPQGYTVAATGNLTGKKRNADNTITYTYNAENVHDFAWSAGLDFEVFADTYDGIEIQLFMPKNHTKIKDNYIAAIKASIKYFGQWYGRYPYSKITMIDPPFGGEGAGGMEYPTLITLGTDLIFYKYTRLPELVTAHEFAHQYWYGLVASNEAEEAWLDEGITSYSTAKLLDMIFSPQNSGLDFMGMQLSAMDREKLTYLADPQDDPIYNKSWEYISTMSYAVNSYSKPALFLGTMENLIGRDKVDLILRTYFSKYQYRHPHTSDFENIVKEIVGDKLNAFIQEIIYGTGTIDYAVSSIKNEQILKKKGIYDTEKGRIEITDADLKNNENKNIKYKSETIVKRLGEISMPVEIEFRFGDGKNIVKVWDGKKRWQKFNFAGETQLECTVVDPKNKLLLDINTANNSKCIHKNAGFIVKYSSKIGAFSQYILTKLLCVL